MNYQKIHDAIILSAQQQVRNKRDGLYELHHIIPRAFGGSDDSDNLVLLTLREHFIIHILLWKINPCRKTSDPVLFFRHKGANNSRMYEEVRKFHINEMRTNNPSLYLSQESRQSKSAKLKEYAKNRTPEHNKKISESKKGQATRTGAILEDESKNKISQSLRVYYELNPVSEQTREKLRIKNTGKKHSADSLEKMKQSAINRKRYSCVICGKCNLDGGNFTIHLKKHGITDKEEIKKLKQE